MGTDRNEVVNIPCPCRQGRIIVTNCSPDHDYPRNSQSWRDEKILCRDCEPKYCIVEQEEKLVLVRRQECEQTEAAKKQKLQEMERLKQELWENLEKNGELDAVVGYLNSFKTTATAYRHLSNLNICLGFDDFREKFPKQNCTKERVRQYIYPQALNKLLAQMQTPSKILERYFNHDLLLQSRTIPTPKPIGGPILVLNR